MFAGQRDYSGHGEREKPVPPTEKITQGNRNGNNKDEEATRTKEQNERALRMKHPRMNGDPNLNMSIKAERFHGILLFRNSSK